MYQLVRVNEELTNKTAAVRDLRAKLKSAEDDATQAVAQLTSRLQQSEALNAEETKTKKALQSSFSTAESKVCDRPCF